MTRHPGDDKLVAWLESGRPRRVGRHVEECESCMTRIESVSDLDGSILTDLASASSPPPDLYVRTTDRVQDRLAAEEALSVLLDLFSVPWNTANALLTALPIERQPTAGSVPVAPVADDTQPAPPERDNPEERSDG